MGITPYAAGSVHERSNLPGLCRDGGLRRRHLLRWPMAPEPHGVRAANSACAATRSFGDAGTPSSPCAAARHGRTTTTSDRNVTATFQALPGASFVVNGAAQAHDAALTTASAEIKWLNGFSLAASFEGEFSSRYAQLRRQGRRALSVVSICSARPCSVHCS